MTWLLQKTMIDIISLFNESILHSIAWKLQYVNYNNCWDSNKLQA